MKKISYILFSILALLSCSQEGIEGVTTSSEEVMARFSFAVQPMHNFTVGTAPSSAKATTRSVAATGEVDENTVKDMWVFQFDNAGNLVKKCYITTFDKDHFDVPLASVNANSPCKVYFLANVGTSVASPTSEAALKIQLKRITTESDLFHTVGATKYLPMIAVVNNVVVPSTGVVNNIGTLIFTRLVAKVTYTCQLSTTVLSKLNIESARLCNVPYGIQFSPISPATTTVPTIDLEREPITLTDGAITLTYYLPENTKGTVSNATSDERLKLGVGGATYIEIIGRTKGVDGGDEIGFRTYLGNDNITNYDILRGGRYTVTATIDDISETDQRVRIHDRANCYTVAPGATIKIPVMRANDSPEMGVQIPDVEAVGAWIPMVYWQTAAGLVDAKRVGTKDSYITVKAPNGITEGNAVVAIKDASDKILWSWHIWVMKADINNADNQFVSSNGFTFMDRNLGATDPGNEAVGFKNYDTSAGLVYQWGRKDPFTLCVNAVDGKGAINLFNEAGTPFLPNAAYYTGLNATQCNASDPYTYRVDISAFGFDKGLAASIKYPALYIPGWLGSTSTSNANNANNGVDSWGGEFGQPKSAYDPCPEGWRVPSYKRTSSSMAGTLFGGSIGLSSAGSISSSTLSTYNYIVVSGKRWSFPFCGYRNTDGQIYNVGTFSRFWGATMHDYTTGRFTQFYGVGASPTTPTYDQSNANTKAVGESIRCAREW